MMKFFCMAIILLNGLFANAAYIPATDEQIVIGTNNAATKTLQSKMATMSVADYENLTGKKMGLFKR